MVYFNTGEYGISHNEPERAIAELKGRYVASLAAIAVLLNGKLH